MPGKNGEGRPCRDEPTELRAARKDSKEKNRARAPAPAAKSVPGVEGFRAQAGLMRLLEKLQVLRMARYAMEAVLPRPRSGD